MRTEINVKTGEIDEYPDAPAPQPKTQAEIDAELEEIKDAIVNDMISQNTSIIKALVLCLNDGSVVPGANMTIAELKAVIKARL